MLFDWNPLNPAPSEQKLRMIYTLGQKLQEVDPRVRPVQTAGNSVHGGDLIENGVIYTYRAKTMVCISTAVVNGRRVLEYQRDLYFFEHCLAHVAGGQFVGNDDPSFT